MKSSVDAFLPHSDDEMIHTIVDHTNIKGARENGRKWKDTDTIEMKIFATCRTLCQNDINVEELFTPVEGNPFVQAAFSMKRFSNLLRFDGKTSRCIRHERDVFYPVCGLWDASYSKLAKHFVAGESIIVNEPPVSSRNRCKFTQYMPSKSDKYGIKILWSCDAKKNLKNYPLRAFPYSTFQRRLLVSQMLA